jgi:hypothetical protein
MYGSRRYQYSLHYALAHAHSVISQKRHRHSGGATFPRTAAISAALLLVPQPSWRPCSCTAAILAAASQAPAALQSPPLARLCLSTENRTLIQENRKRNPPKLIPMLKFHDQNPRFLEKMPIKRIETSARGAYYPHR